MKKRKPIPVIRPSSGDDVAATLNLLREAISEEEQRIRTEGAQAMQCGNYSTATAVIDFARQLQSFQGWVEDLERRWATIEILHDCVSPEVRTIVSRRFFGRTGSGEITPHQDYCRPILEVLVEMGGRGPTGEVIDRVGEKMKGILKPKDYELHESEAGQIRWRNSAQWARNHMVNVDGRMKKGTRNGFWAISDTGRSWLKKECR